MTRRKNAEKLLMMAGCLAAAFLLLLLCSQSSPLYPTNTWVDANCLLTVGRAMKSGSVLYRDIYEQKGPTLYLIHWIAACISDSSFFGVFVLEVLSLAATLYASYSMMRQRLNGCAALSAAVLAGALILTGGAFAQGDSAEEFCLPYLTGALCLAYCAYGSRKGPMDAKSLFACGLMAGMVATIKYPVLGLFVGLCAAEGVLALRKGGMLRALRSAGVFLGGMLLPVAAWVIYFAAHGALADFYTAYIHNNIFLYSDEARGVLDILRDNPLSIVEVACPLDICRERNIARGDRYETQSQEQAELMAKDIQYAMTVHTDQHTPEECAEAILRCITQ